MVNGLERFCDETEFDFIDENQITVDKEEITLILRVTNYIESRTEKIIGALDFIYEN